MARRRSTWSRWKRVRPVPVLVWVTAGLFWLIWGITQLVHRF
jgi:hypothetical protein